MRQARIVLRDRALERAKHLLEVTKLGTFSELINVMLARYGGHLEQTWEVKATMLEQPSNQPERQVGQHKSEKCQ